jgi:hypothetical protein
MLDALGAIGLMEMSYPPRSRSRNDMDWYDRKFNDGDPHWALRLFASAISVVPIIKDAGAKWRRTAPPLGREPAIE